MSYQFYDETLGQWFPGIPEKNGQKYRFFDSAGGVVESTWSSDYQDMRITRLGFLNRFSDAEAIAIDLASIGATSDAAMIRRFVSKVNAAQYIDLARQDTRDGVSALEQMGLIAQGRTDEILGPPISEDEKWRG